MSEPRPPKTELTSPARSLITPLRDLYVFVGFQDAGEGVISGRSSAAIAGLIAAGEA